MIRRLISTALLLSCCASFASAQNLFFEDFQGLTSQLQVAVDAPNGEGPSGQNNVAPNLLGWTHTAPAGWFRDASGVPTVGNPDAGVMEWEGWSFATQDFWVDADDQQRSMFTPDNGAIPTSENIVAIADGDEWDDWGSPADTIGLFNTNLFTPAIDVSGVDLSTQMLQLSFDSSWRDECCDDGPITGADNNQTAVLLAAFDGTPVEILRWESDPMEDANGVPTNPFFKDDAPDEFITLDIAAPTGTSSIAFAFQMENAGNDWWWAVDNISVDAVPEPATGSILFTALLCAVGVLRRR